MSIRVYPVNFGVDYSLMWFRQIQYSFPVRLLALHFRSHLVLIFLWVVLSLLVTGQLGHSLGMHYLMLTPEYRGEVGFLSFFITGTALGAFIMIWNLTTYLLCADRFPFLATLGAPFTKFSINNSLIPAGFLMAYFSAAIWFQAHDELIGKMEIVKNIAGLLLGAIVFILFLAGYLYFTNKDIVSFLRPGKFVPRPGGRLLVPGRRTPTLGEIKAGATRWRVDTYLTERCHVRLVRSVAHYDPYLLGKVFRQNHANAIVVLGVALGLLMVQGWLLEYEWFRFPTSVNIFVLASIGMALFGAITFWFRQWSTFAFILLIVVINAFTAKGYFIYRNKAFGLNYSTALRPAYNYDLLEKLSTDSILAKDKLDTEAVLNKWLSHQKTSKPKMILVCVSGGGLRSSLWAMRVMQAVDSLTKGNFLNQTALFTGASGGMLSAGYLREVMLREKSGEKISTQDPGLFADLGLDLLNPISTALVSNDLIFPVQQYHYAGQTYQIDRGYYFERQFNANLKGRMGKKVSDYRAAEQNGIIPMMVISPFIINDSRRVLISPLGVSYLTRPGESVRRPVEAEVDGVEWSRLFAQQQGDSLSFVSALRMNCTFPFILPNTWLPTRPSLEIMDAGLRDNFGITLSARFIHTFKNWIQEHTSGVVLVQIRCWEKVESVVESDEKGIIGDLLTPAEAAARITVQQDYDQDNTLALVSDLLGDNRLEVVRFVYRPVRRQREASLSFHLSRREKIDIYEAFNLPENLTTVTHLQNALR